MKTRLITSSVALATAIGAPAIADVTAADVWANQQALYASMGITLAGDLDGDSLTNPEMNVVLPQGLASVQIKADDITMVTNSDGTVTISYPSPMTIEFSGGAKDAGSFSGVAVLTNEGHTVTASGEPGDIAYVSEGTGLRMQFADVEVTGGETESFALEGWVTLDSFSGETRVTEGNLISYTAQTETGESAADFTVTIDNVVSRSTQTTLPVESSFVMTLPAGGSDLMNLSAALRDGLTLAMESKGAGSSSTSETLLDGEPLNTQSTSTGTQDFAMTFGEEGLVISGEAEDFDMVMNDPLVFPGDLEFGVEGLSIAYDFPLNASDEPQDFRVATAMTGITLGDTIWNLFDPAAQLPRDPADVSFDITGVGTNGMDLLDFAAMAEMFGPPPVQVDEVTIHDLRVAAVGAEATAEGAMTFDWTDFNTIPGMPRPEGAVTININGANQLMDKLVAMGLIPEEELMMPRMMMGMFATPVGDDMLESVIEVNDQGHVLANGQRLQ